VAEALAPQGISVEVIDPRTVVPLDFDTIAASIRKTGRLVVASEDVSTCGFASEVAARAAERCWTDLHAPVLRVSSADVPVPFAPDSEKLVLPDEARIERAVLSVARRAA
jgi:pyruvate dehydrogenase E1 component beta subunit